jgi:hypothetical protein
LFAWGGLGKDKKMNKQEAKEYIKQQWNISSGSRIATMLKRYWSLKEGKINPTKFDLVEEAKKIFLLGE